MDELNELPADAGALRRLNVLYLVAQLEDAIKRGGVAWIPKDVVLPERVADLSSALRGQIDGVWPAGAASTSGWRSSQSRSSAATTFSWTRRRSLPRLARGSRIALAIVSRMLRSCSATSKSAWSHA
jgi:hypothetical protein